MSACSAQPAKLLKWLSTDLRRYYGQKSNFMCTLSAWVGRPGKSVTDSLHLLRRKQRKLVSGSRIKMVVNQTGGSELLPKGKDRRGVAGSLWLCCELGWSLEGRQGAIHSLDTMPLVKWRQQGQKLYPWLHSKFKACLNCIIRREIKRKKWVRWSPKAPLMKRQWLFASTQSGIIETRFNPHVIWLKQTNKNRQQKWGNAS